MAGYLTAAQIAELLQVSEKSAYRWAAGDPTFPMLKIRRTVRFPRERVIRWLREREQGSGGPECGNGRSRSRSSVQEMHRRRAARDR